MIVIFVWIDLKKKVTIQTRIIKIVKVKRWQVYQKNEKNRKLLREETM